jgi:hypothetical protein
VGLKTYIFEIEIGEKTQKLWEGYNFKQNFLKGAKIGFEM